MAIVWGFVVVLATIAIVALALSDDSLGWAVVFLLRVPLIGAIGIGNPSREVVVRDVAEISHPAVVAIVAENGRASVVFDNECVIQASRFKVTPKIGDTVEMWRLDNPPREAWCALDGDKVLATASPRSPADWLGKAICLIPWPVFLIALVKM